jgi:hypothetical protein
MAALPRPRSQDNLLRRIWNEYLEMPGLRLTAEQAQRLWALDAETCTGLLETLMELRFLTRGPDGRYCRLTDGPAGGLLMAKADFANRNQPCTIPARR